MSFSNLTISSITDQRSLTVYANNTATYGISNALLNGAGTTTPTSYWRPNQIPPSSLYLLYVSTGAVNPTNYRLWAYSDSTTNATYLPSTVQLLVNTSTFVDSTPVWNQFYLNGNPSSPYGFTYENAVGPGTLSNVTNLGIAFNYFDNDTNDPETYGIKLLNLRVQGTSYVPVEPPIDYIKEPVIKSCGCGPKSIGPGAVLESMLLAKKIQNCSVITSKMAQQLVNSQLRGVPSSVRTQKVQQDTLECYAPITDPIRRQALYQGPVITPPCPPTPAEELNSTRPKVSQGGDCLQQVPFYQRPSK